MALDTHCEHHGWNTDLWIPDEHCGWNRALRIPYVTIVAGTWPSRYPLWVSRYSGYRCWNADLWVPYVTIVAGTQLF